jgi:hypothetical protein
MTFLLGFVLIAIGSILVFVARERGDGTSILPIKPPMDMIYPAVCLALLAFGAALIITG